MTETTKTPRQRQTRASEKKLTAAHVSVPAKRDSNGRFIAGHSGGPGRPPVDPTMKALATADRQKNFDFIRGLRDDSKADPELRFEAAKLLAQYSDGKPITSALPTTAVQVNVNGQTASTVLSGPVPAEEMRRRYKELVSGVTVLAPDATIIPARQIEHRPRQDARAGVIDVAVRPGTSPVVAAPAHCEALPERPVSAVVQVLTQLGAEEPTPAEPPSPSRAEVERAARAHTEAENNAAAERERIAGLRRAHAIEVEQARLDGRPTPALPAELEGAQ